ncbi:flagellar biosynthesis protein FlgA, partial [Klebsiella aerogenes]
MVKKLIIALLIGAASLPATAERIRDLVTVQGVRDNALIGYGLVVGLDGSGDQTMQTPF